MKLSQAYEGYFLSKELQFSQHTIRNYTDPLFATKTGEHIRRDNLRNTLYTIGKTAGVANIHPHRFRHTFAVNFLRNGGNIALLQELLGHTSLTMVVQYVKLAEQDIEKAAKHSPADHMKL